MATIVPFATFLERQARRRQVAAELERRTVDIVATQSTTGSLAGEALPVTHIDRPLSITTATQPHPVEL